MNLIKFEPSANVFGYTTTKSSDAYSDNNLSFTVGDDYHHVIKNREHIAAQIGIPLERWVFARQAHTDKIAKVTLDDAGRGARNHEDGIEDVDGLYTFEKNLVLAFFHADCVPILLADPKSHMIAAIHSGWQGTLSEITTKALYQIIEKENLDPQHIKVYVGPCLSFENSKIDEDIEPYLQGSTFDKSDYITQMDGHYQIDTRGLTLKMLLDSGIQQKNIQNLQEDTFELDDKYFSFQRENKTGRHLTFIYQK